MSWRYYNPGYVDLVNGITKSKDTQLTNGIKIPYVSQWDGKFVSYVDFPATSNLYLLYDMTTGNVDYNCLRLDSSNYQINFGYNYVSCKELKTGISRNLATNTQQLVRGNNRVLVHLNSGLLEISVNKSKVISVKDTDIKNEKFTRFYFADTYSNSDDYEYYKGTTFNSLIISDEPIQENAILKEIKPEVISEGWTANSDGSYFATDTDKKLTLSLPVNASELSGYKVINWTPVAKNAVAGVNITSLNISGKTYALTNTQKTVGGYVGTDKTIISKGG